MMKLHVNTLSRYHFYRDDFNTTYQDNVISIIAQPY